MAISTAMSAPARSPAGFRVAMLLPGALVAFFLILFALGLVLFLALRDNDGSLLGAGFTLSNFWIVATDPLYVMVTLRSLAIAGLVTLATVVTAYPVAYYLAFHAGRRRGLILFLVTLPFWTSYLLRVFAWKIVLAYNGVLNSALVGTGITSEPTLAFLNTPAAVVLTLAHAYAPFAILPIYVALQYDPEIAAGSGKRPRRQAVRDVPAHRSAQFHAGRACRGPCRLRADGRRLRHAGTGRRAGLHDDRFADPGAVRQGQRLAVRGRPCRRRHAGHPGRRADRPGSRPQIRQPLVSAARKTIDTGGRWLGAYVLAYLVFLYLPVSLIPLFSFNDSVQAAFPLQGFTLAWYATLLGNPTLSGALVNSLTIGAVAATGATLCGITVSYMDLYGRSPLAAAISALSRLPILIPGVIVGISLLILVNLAGFGPSRLAIVLGHILVALPTTVVVMRSRFAAIPKSMCEAALDLGAGDWTTFRRVMLPLAAPAIASAFMLAFLTSFDEFIVAFFLAGTEQTLPLYIWAQLRFPKSLPTVMALGSVILAVSVIIAALAEFLRHRGLAAVAARAADPSPAKATERGELQWHST